MRAGIKVFSVFLLVTIFLHSGCSTDPNEKANELYVEASQLMQSVKAEAEAGRYSGALELYQDTQEKIKHIFC